MPPETDHNRLTMEAIEQGIEALGITPSEFARLLGLNRKTVKRWLLPADHSDYLAPPFWLTVMLGLLLLPGGLDRARFLSDHHAKGADR